MSSNGWIFASTTTTTTSGGRRAAPRSGGCRPNHRNRQTSLAKQQQQQQQQRSMSVVVRPTYYDCDCDCEGDRLSDGIDADRTMMPKGRQTSLSASSPSVIMAALKKRSPPATSSSSRSAVIVGKSANSTAASAGPDGDSDNICGRLASFNSTSSLHSSAASASSSSSSSSSSSKSSTHAMRRSVSEPDFRRAGGGITNTSENDNGDDKEENKKGQEAQDVTGISDDDVVGSASDEVGTCTAHDLRADYVAIHASIDHTRSPPTNKMIVVVPSIDLDGDELKRVSTFIENYEERQLYHLLMLNDPGVRVVYTSSHPVSEAVVRYYVGLRGNGAGIAAPSISDQMSRLYMLSPNDASKRPLSKKLLARPLVLRLIKRLMESMEESSCPDAQSNFHRLSGTDNSAAFLSTAGLSVYTGSNACDNLAHSLGLRLLESCGETMHFGTKQGSREIFAAAGIPHPGGTPDLTVGDEDLLTLGLDNRPGKKHWASHHPYIRTPRALAIGLARQILIKKNRPKKWMVKLNQGFSGMGNASLDLKDIQNEPYEHIQEGDARISAMADDIESILPSRLKFECPCMTWEGCDQHIGFLSQIEKLGVIAEAFLDGEVPTSPSFQAVVEPDSHVDGGHSVRMLSTHEQLLDGQIYEGCINPCSSRYRTRVVEYGKKVGQQLEANGIVGHFSCDFLATKNSEGDWDLNAVEINLRQGGTTHPHAHMALLCGGQLEDDGVFHMLNGDPRFYVATDCYRDEGLKGMDDADLISFIQNEKDPEATKIRWDPASKTGVVFHLFKFIKPYGRIGFTAIGASSDDAHILYDETVKLLKQISKKRTKC